MEVANICQHLSAPSSPRFHRQHSSQQLLFPLIIINTLYPSPTCSLTNYQPRSLKPFRYPFHSLIVLSLPIMSRKLRIPSGKALRTHTRGTGPIPLLQDASMFSSEASWSEDDDDILVHPPYTHTTTPLTPPSCVLLVMDIEADSQRFQKFNATQLALKATNDCIQRKLTKVQANIVRLKRELWLLQRHVKNFNHPLYETWEADILTRLIEIAHAYQRCHKLHAGVAISNITVAERENIFHAYSNAAKQVRESTLLKLGLGEKYYEALSRYHEVREILLIG